MKVEVSGVPEVVNALMKVKRGIADLRQLGTWKMVRSEFQKVVAEQFAAEGQGESGKWQALKPTYVPVKMKRWGDQPILQASGRGYRALTSSNGDSVFEEQPQEATFGTSLSYMGYHQKGTKKMPKRPPVDFTESQRKRVFEPINKKLEQLIDNAKLRDLQGYGLTGELK
jgi:phage gpG-like protein